MKDSGIEWIGAIPDDWELKKIKYILKSRNENNKPIKSKNILSLTAKQGVVPLAEKEGGGNKPKADFTGYKLTYPGDIVMNSMNILSGSVGLSRCFGCVSPVYYMLRPYNIKYDVRFFNYIFQTTVFQRSLIGLGNGILIKESDNGNLNTIRMRIPLDKLGNLYLPVANGEEQKKIADFLDNKCDKIEEIKSTLTQEIEKLEEYRKSIISESVTGNYSKVKLKYCCDFNKGLSITKADLVDSGLPVINYGQIHSKQNISVNLNEDLIRYISDDILFNNISLANKYEFIFADTSEDIEGCGNFVFNSINRNIYAGYHTILVRNKDERIYNHFLAYLFKSYKWKSQIESRVMGIKVYSITQRILKDTSIVIPPLEEQKEIVKYLDDKCSKIDEIIEIKKEQIDKIDEYKKSLIYEYVTGKKRVE